MLGCNARYRRQQVFQRESNKPNRAAVRLLVQGSIEVLEQIMRILIVDDETLARDRLRRMLEDDERHEVIGDVGNGIEALTVSSTLYPDLILLDIRMPGMDGVETARHFSAQKEPPAIIFCTAYEEHAIQAFELQAVGYLLKPVRRENLYTALANASRLNKVQLSALTGVDDSRRTHLCARTYKGVELVSLNDIRYLRADQKYVTVRHAGGEVIIDETLRELEHEFEDLFLRVHRNALVSKNHIVGLEKGVTGQIGVGLEDIEETVYISRRHLPGVRKIVRRL